MDLLDDNSPNDGQMQAKDLAPDSPPVAGLGLPPQKQGAQRPLAKPLAQPDNFDLFDLTAPMDSAPLGQNQAVLGQEGDNGHFGNVGNHAGGEEFGGFQSAPVVGKVPDGMTKAEFDLINLDGMGK